MDNKNLNPKSDRIILYIIFAIVFAYIIFNLPSVWSAVTNILSLATPFYVALVIAFIFNIPIRHLERLFHYFIKKINKFELKPSTIRALAIGITLICFILLIFVFFSFIVPSIGESISLIFSSLDNYAVRLSQFITKFAKSLNIDYELTQTEVNTFFASINLGTILETISSLFGAESTGNITTIINSISGIATSAITSIFMSIYILANKETYITQFRKLLIFILGEKRGIRILEITDEATHYFNHFVSGALLEATIFMTIVYISLRIFQLPFPELIGLCAFIFSFIPIFGSFLTLCIGAILVAAASSKDLLLFIILFICIQQFEGNVVYPKIVGKSVGISGLYVLLGITIFGRLFGVIGVILAVPFTAIIYAILSRIVNIKLYRRKIDISFNHIAKTDENGDITKKIY